MHSQLKVLLIESDEDDAEQVRRLLAAVRDCEIIVEWVASREAALAKVAPGVQNPRLYDAILLGYESQQYVGLELLKEIQQQAATPVIVLTREEDPQADVAVTESGAYDYLVKKHINAPLLERSIRYAAHRHRIENAWHRAVQENQRLAAAINDLSIGIIITDYTQPDNPIIFANPAFTAITEYSVAEATGRNCRFLAGPGTDKSTTQKIRRAIHQKRPFHGLILNHRKNGSTFWNELRITPLCENGTVINWVGLMEDASERVRAEENTRLLVRDLAERVKELSAVHAVSRTLQNELVPLDQRLMQVLAELPAGFQFPDKVEARLLMGERVYSPSGTFAGACTLERSFQLSNQSLCKLQVCCPNEPELPSEFLREEQAMLDSVAEMLRSRIEQDLSARALLQANEELETRVAQRTRELEELTSELRGNHEHLRQINREILQLSRSKVPHQGELKSTLQAFTEAAVRSMDVERAGIWLFEQDRSRVRCIEFYDAQDKEHSDGFPHTVADFPQAFSAIGRERVLAVDDAQQDERVPDFYQEFLNLAVFPRSCVLPFSRIARRSGSSGCHGCNDRARGPSRIKLTPVRWPI